MKILNTWASTETHLVYFHPRRAAVFSEGGCTIHLIDGKYTYAINEIAVRQIAGMTKDGGATAKKIFSTINTYLNGETAVGSEFEYMARAASLTYFKGLNLLGKKA